MAKLAEKWKPIVGYEGLYEISNLGRVKSLAREWTGGNGSVQRKKETIQKNHLRKDGYYMVCLSRTGVGKSFQVAHLVWDHFGKGKRNGYIIHVDHIDENPKNNRIDNLQLLTARENISKHYRLNPKTSKYIGVSYEKRYDKFSAQIMADNKMYYLGFFKKEIDAHEEYQRALKEFKGTGSITVLTPATKKRKSKYKGVFINSAKGSKRKWRSSIMKNKKIYYIGTFTTEEEAHAAYQKASEELGNGKEK